jgi:hypothetical protein
MKKNRIVIVVEGGMISTIAADQPIDILILDHDRTEDIGEDNPYEPDQWQDQDTLHVNKTIDEFNHEHKDDPTFQAAPKEVA